MKPRRNAITTPFVSPRALSACLALGAIAFPLAAQGDPPPSDFFPAREPYAPPGLDEGDFAALRGASPFSRVLDPAETYALRGYARLDGIQWATLYNKQTQKTLVVDPETLTEEGLRLIEIQTAPELEEVSARISFGGEEIELKYEPAQLSPQPRPPRSEGSRGSGEGERRGPSPQDIERFRSLSEENQQKLRDYIGHIMRTYPEMSRTERGNMIRGAVVRLADGRDLEVPPAPEGGGERGSGERGSGGSSRERESRGRGQ
jgi:hypothetical protein